jgi:hypothetical protein
MNRGDLVYTNFFGEENSLGILLEVKRLPKDAIEFHTCSVLLPSGRVKVTGSSFLLTVEEMEVLL